MSSKKQNFALEESLSAMTDGEASELELRRLLQSMSSDDSEADALRSRWQRYQLASAAMRKQPAMVDLDISSSISEAIADEPAHSVTARKKPKFLVNVARLGIAASIAGAMVVGLQSVSEQEDIQLANGQVNGLSLTSQPVSTNSKVVRNNSTPFVIDQKHLQQAEAQQYQQLELDLNRLMSEHTQNASQNTQFGILPYARLPAGE